MNIEFQSQRDGKIAVTVNGQPSGYYLSKQPRRYNAGWHLNFGNDGCFAKGDLRTCKAKAIQFISEDPYGK
jgi:hypothetical protein